MKKLFSFILTMAVALSMCACSSQKQQTQGPAVLRSFIAGYEDEISNSSGRVLVNLLDDGTAKFYAGIIENDVHTTAEYDGTYSIGENEEFDETITINYTYDDGQTGGTENAVIIDDIFEMPFYFCNKMTAKEIKFYETAPASVDGNVYVGYLTKTTGMGLMSYAYSLCLKDDSTFDVSIMQMASVMHVWGATDGTYKADGENITFTYDIRTTEGEVVSADDIAEGTNFTDTTLVTAFNIQQATMRASDAEFIRVK